MGLRIGGLVGVEREASWRMVELSVDEEGGGSGGMVSVMVSLGEEGTWYEAAGRVSV